MALLWHPCSHYSLAIACLCQCSVRVGPGACDRQCSYPLVRKERKPFDSEVRIRAGPGMSIRLFHTFLISETLYVWPLSIPCWGNWMHSRHGGTYRELPKLKVPWSAPSVLMRIPPGPVGLKLPFQSCMFSWGLLNRLGKVLGYKDFVKVQRCRQADDGRFLKNNV